MPDVTVSLRKRFSLKAKEENILKGIVTNIELECNGNLDQFSQNIIISQIETLLNYSDRFYQRHFPSVKSLLN